MKSEFTRNTILQAANRIVQREGVAHLTIDAVAKEASLSKGGVLYHFASKDALVEGMLTSMVDNFNHDMARFQVDDKLTAGQYTRAFIRATVDSITQEDAIATALLAAIGTNPRLLAPIRQSYAQWQAQLEQDGLSPALATLLRLAADGLWIADLFGLASPQGQLRTEVIQMLLKMTKQSHD
jgi:AcrR family transcriptional regulator